MTSETLAAPRLALQRAGELVRESWRYFLVSIVALGVDYGLLLALTEIAHLHYLASSAISYTTGGVVHYLLSVTLVFRNRRLSDRWVEFAAFFGLGLLGLAATQAVLKVSVEGLGMSYATAKLGAVGASFALNFVARKALLFSKAPSAP
jgi:putative flippase GtrA